MNLPKDIAKHHQENTLKDTEVRRKSNHFENPPKDKGNNMLNIKVFIHSNNNQLNLNQRLKPSQVEESPNRMVLAFLAQLSPKPSKPKY